MTAEEKADLYMKLYHKSISDMESAINALIQSQRECEELYLKATEDEPPEDE